MKGIRDARGMLPVRSEYTYKIKLKNKPPPFFKTGKPVAEPEPPPAVPEPCALPAANKKPVSKRRAFQAGGRTRTAAGSTGAVPLPAENKKPVSKRRAFQAGGRTRTDDLRITNALLYQLSHTSIFNYEFGFRNSEFIVVTAADTCTVAERRNICSDC